MADSSRTDFAVTVRGSGPALLLAHGWPHSRQVWSEVIDELAAEFTVVAPDLPGIGGSAAPAGYDAEQLARSLDALMTDLGHGRYAVIAIDASVPAAFLLATTCADRVWSAVLMEGTLPPLPGAEAFFAAGPPWWFGFHAVPGLAESVLAGHETEYVEFFLDNGTLRALDDDTRSAMVSANTGDGRLAQGFEYYRAMPTSARQTLAASQRYRLRVPTLAIGGNVVGEALACQLQPVTDDLTAHLIPDCGHIVPLDAPRPMLDLVLPFLREHRYSARTDS